MIISSAWQCLSVAEFWQLNSWHQTSQEAVDTTELEVDLAKCWQTNSVECFFASSNWQGKDKLENKHKKDIFFSQALAVKDFWQCFAWKEGKVVSRSTRKNASNFFSKTASSSISKKSASLADLSQLF